jgi:hypothetical protein
MTAVEATVWTVQFVGDYFTLTTTVIAEEEEQAIANATAQLEDRYGMDMGRDANESDAWEIAQ